MLFEEDGDFIGKSYNPEMPKGYLDDDSDFILELNSLKSTLYDLYEIAYDNGYLAGSDDGYYRGFDEGMQVALNKFLDKDVKNG